MAKRGTLVSSVWVIVALNGKNCLSTGRSKETDGFDLSELVSLPIIAGMLTSSRG